jgi:hypothetical protein
MSSSTATALSSLTALPQLQKFYWVQSEQSGESEVQGVLDSLAQLTQLTTLLLGYNLAADYKAPLSSLITAPSKMVSLRLFEIDFVPHYMVTDGSEWYSVNLESNSIWEQLDVADLQQLLTRHTMLKTLTLNSVVLSQAGLDLLLAHPHIVNVTMLAIAATGSRVDSPCSWHTLTLAKQVDVRTVAYVPLHSLRQPLQIGSLLLPPDIFTDQLPRLLQAATTRMAANRHLFSLHQPAMLIIEDLSARLPGPTPGEAPAARHWTPDVCSALFQAVTRLAVYENITGRVGVHLRPGSSLQSYCYLGHDVPTLLQRLVPIAGIDITCKLNNTGPWATDTAPIAGAAEVSTLSTGWGSRLRSLTLNGFQLAPSFFPALTKQLPGLQFLELPRILCMEGLENMAAWVVALCTKLTRPLKLAVPLEIHQ